MSTRATRFNRAVGNRIAGPMLRRMPGFGTVHHRGRKSGREYTTPVKLFRAGDQYVITLPYGPGSDWVRNISAAGGGEISTRGKRFTVTAPTVGTDIGSVRIPVLLRVVLSAIGCTEFLSLTPVRTGSVR